ncbi:hypothetical protein PanWU01x14_291690 [Parasponia andersonii]|uniref:DUF4408 domain-containing protein n=1 Tax=Parasponia andersonii TaxID=3476 RepID=A0A2P5AXE8_PARAD|nr:hypothetical protein PanWU01x14_291690 [Parasponia andersonii]
MNIKFKKSQVLILSLLAVLLIIAPLLSSSLRPTYLYFITNLLIITIGAEAGLLSLIFSKPSLEDNNNKTKDTFPVPQKTAGVLASEASSEKRVVLSNTNDSDEKLNGFDQTAGKKVKCVEKSLSEKIIGSVKADRVKKCPSMPSLFFIGGDENEGNLDEDYHEEEEEELVGEITGQELFTKAETFIGNFYKQLMMQREESWKRIHGFYQRAF